MTGMIPRYTGDALGGLINASLGNATEFIIVRNATQAVRRIYSLSLQAILLLVKCEIRVAQASLLGGLLSKYV
jgi:Ca2+/H+ antiporter